MMVGILKGMFDIRRQHRTRQEKDTWHCGVWCKAPGYITEARRATQHTSEQCITTAHTNRQARNAVSQAHACVYPAKCMHCTAAVRYGLAGQEPLRILANSVPHKTQDIILQSCTTEFRQTAQNGSHTVQLCTEVTRTSPTTDA